MCVYVRELVRCNYGGDRKRGTVLRAAPANIYVQLKPRKHLTPG